MLLKYIEGSLRDITFRFNQNTKPYLKGCYEICKEEQKELAEVLNHIDENDPNYKELRKDYTRLSAALRYYEENIEKKP